MANPNLKKQHGTAIIVALFVMAIAAAGAVAMMARMQVDIHRSQALFRTDESNQLAQGSIAWAIDSLNHAPHKTPAETAAERMPLTSPTQHENGFTIETTIEDEQAKFNVNNLVETDALVDFKNLLHLVAPNVDNDVVLQLLAALQDWLTPNNNNTALNEYYAHLKPAYRPAHRLMTSISELRLVRGVSAELYEQLLPFVTALPESTPVNVNHAPSGVLQTLLPGLSAQAAKSVIDYRQETPFATPKDFLAFEPIKNVLNDKLANKIATTSAYFLIKTQVHSAGQAIHLYTLVFRQPGSGKVKTIILWQSKGFL